MRLLLDTHVLIWWLAGDARLSPEAVAAVRDSRERTYCSVVSLWEIVVKTAAGKLELDEDIFSAVARHPFGLLPVEVEHVAQLARLPLIHRDPFDRLLIAQTITEGLVLVTSDAAIARYPIATLPAS